MNSSAGSGLCPGLQESNTPIIIRLRQKSTQEAHQGKGLRKQRTEAMTNEEERVADVLGLSPLEYPSCAFPPLRSRLSRKAQKATEMKLNNHLHFQTHMKVQGPGLGSSLLRIHTSSAWGISLLCQEHYRPQVTPTLLSRPHVIFIIKPLPSGKHLVVYKAFSHSLSHLSDGRSGSGSVFVFQGLRIDLQLPPHPIFTPRILVISDTQDNMIKVQQILQVWSLTAATNTESITVTGIQPTALIFSRKIGQVGRIVPLITVGASRLLSPYPGTPRPTAWSGY